MQYPTVNLGVVKTGDRVEVRLFQDTHIEDKNASKAYCWVAGTVQSSEGATTRVKLDLDADKFKNGDPKMVDGETNKFNVTDTGGVQTGFQYANVSVNVLRRI